MGLTRRTFLGSGAAALVAGTMTKGTVFGANERVNLCVIGVGGQGGSLMSNFQQQDHGEVIALCDADTRTLDARANHLERTSGKTPKKYQDIREALADDEIDAVVIATPNHWHALASIWAMMAGKDVYVEKPLSHTHWEGQQLVKWQERTGRILMHGTQNRSSARWMRDIQLLHDGSVIGPVHMAKGYTYKTGNRRPIGFADPSSPPDHLDWNLWQGPAAQENEFRSIYHPYNWHWFWDYGNGETGNQGVHEMDLCIWGLNRGWPVQVYSSGGRHVWEDMGETPNVQTSTFTYEDGAMLVFEVRNTGSWDEGGRDTAAHFLAAEGYYLQGKGFFNYNHEPIEVDGPEVDTLGQHGNFLRAVRSGDYNDVEGNALEGHISSSHCHIANVAYRLKRSLNFDGSSETFIADEEANAMLRPSNRTGFEIPDADTA